MNRAPAVLIYKISRFLEVDRLLIIELISQEVRNKLISTISNYHRILRQELGIDEQCDIETCKKHILRYTEGNHLLVLYSDNLLKAYNCITHKYRNIEYPCNYMFDPAANWICISWNSVLVVGLNDTQQNNANFD